MKLSQKMLDTEPLVLSDEEFFEGLENYNDPLPKYVWDVIDQHGKLALEETQWMKKRDNSVIMFEMVKRMYRAIRKMNSLSPKFKLGRHVVRSLSGSGVSSYLFDANEELGIRNLFWSPDYSPDWESVVHVGFRPSGNDKKLKQVIVYLPAYHMWIPGFAIMADCLTVDFIKDPLRFDWVRSLKDLMESDLMKKAKP